MTRLNVTKAREEFPEIVNRAAYGKERTIVSRRGKDLAAVIPIEDLRLLERLARDEMDRQDVEVSLAALKEAEEKGTKSLRDVMRELGDDLTTEDTEFTEESTHNNQVSVTSVHSVVDPRA